MTAYLAAGSELDLFRRAYECEAPVLLLGPTGCGKTLMVERMAAELGRPLVTITCHDDLTTADLVGRHLITGGDVSWQDGPLTSAVRAGSICYLDELVEARADTLAMLHSVADQRRTLFIDRLGESVEAAPGFMLVASHNPRALGSPKELRPSLRQRFVTLRLGYLPPDREAEVVARTGVDPDVAARLARCAGLLRETALRESQAHFDPPSTRTLITAAEVIAAGAGVEDAIESCVVEPLSTDPDTLEALRELVRAAEPRGAGSAA